jgi:hypothetical protein
MMRRDRTLELARLDNLARKARRRGDAAEAARWYRAGLILLQADAHLEAKVQRIIARTGALAEEQAARRQQPSVPRRSLEERANAAIDAGWQSGDPIDMPR